MPASASRGPQEIWFESLRAGKLLIQKCGQCRQAVFFPRNVCPHCGGWTLDWLAPSGRGTVYSTTIVRRKAEQGGDYNVALIDLDEGVRMMGRVDNLAPGEVRIGMSVRARVAGHDQARDAAEAIVVFDVVAAEGASDAA